MKTLPFTTKDEKSAKIWKDYIEKNQDPYGFACMEVASKLGKGLDDGLTPQQAEDKAVFGSGITGFMMGAIAHMVWTLHPRGEEFKRYFNGIHGADPDSEGIVNPAIVTVNTK